MLFQARHHRRECDRAIRLLGSRIACFMLFQARHHRREWKLCLRQGTLPLKGGKAVTSG